MKRYAHDNGLLPLSCGAKIGDPATDHSTRRLIPPLHIATDELDIGLDIFVSALQNAVV